MQMPAVVLERPKMSRALWEALKAHIMRERQRKKQEQEADAEVERQRRERERQQKQDVMTLEETRDQLSQLELRLGQLKDEKHQLFLQLKRVLNEDEVRRRNQMAKDQAQAQAQAHAQAMAHAAAANNDMLLHSGYPGIVMGLPHQVPPSQSIHPHSVASAQPSSQQAMFLHAMSANRGPPANQLYRVGPQPGVPHHPTLLPHGTMKRSRSPSSPPGTGPQSHLMPHHPGNLPSHVFSPYKPQGGYLTAHAKTHPPPPPPPHGAYYLASNAGPPSQPSSLDPGKHPLYISGSQSGPPTRTYMLPSEAGLAFSGSSGESEKYYVGRPPPQSATHVPIHGGAIPIQQSSQGGKTGSITSGFPIRGSPMAAPATREEQFRHKFLR